DEVDEIFAQELQHAPPDSRPGAQQPPQRSEAEELRILTLRLRQLPREDLLRLYRGEFQ
ncbi:unnamed protein product, partial [Prorocentrum cordatum]